MPDVMQDKSFRAAELGAQDMIEARADLVKKLKGLPVGERGPVKFLLAGASAGLLVQLYWVTFQDKKVRILRQLVCMSSLVNTPKVCIAGTAATADS
jgi:hypothetical protein